ncbi:hypothetical protein V5279_20575 [Bradyrhizobium sp. 26S5]|uniref:hypothetical protein n=1 Tax=Bradyrhizobium sp. 26S5 TaxID=3139729 RepID=UPI0030D1655B
MEPKWPLYEVAGDDAVFALGVVSINYTRFERTHVWMLAAVANMAEEHAALFTARTNAADRANVIETFFKRKKWSAEVAAAIKTYIDATRILVTNRNTLIHGNMVRGPNNQAGIFSLNRKGETTMFQASLPEIRQVADDLFNYFEFGLALSNHIASEIHAAARVAGMMVVRNCPILPTIPVHINPSQRKL